MPAYVDPAEAQLKRQFEQALGRSIPDDEWESFKQAAAQSPATTSRRPGIVVRGARSLLTGVVSAFWWLVFPLIGAVWLAVYLGLAWAYGLDTGRGDFGAAFVLGVVTMVLWAWKVTRIWLVLAFSGCLVALAIGAIVHVAGG